MQFLILIYCCRQHYGTRQAKVQAPNYALTRPTDFHVPFQESYWLYHIWHLGCRFANNALNPLCWHSCLWKFFCIISKAKESMLHFHQYPEKCRLAQRLCLTYLQWPFVHSMSWWPNSPSIFYIGYWQNSIFCTSHKFLFKFLINFRLSETLASDSLFWALLYPLLKIEQAENCTSPNLVAPVAGTCLYTNWTPRMTLKWLTALLQHRQVSTGLVPEPMPDNWIQASVFHQLLPAFWVVNGSQNMQSMLLLINLCYYMNQCLLHFTLWQTKDIRSLCQEVYSLKFAIGEVCRNREVRVRVTAKVNEFTTVAHA